MSLFFFWRAVADPLRVEYPLLAQYLGAHGYATAGFVANTVYCSYDTGLGSEAAPTT